MVETLEKAVKELTGKSENAKIPCDAMQFAQAALNLTQAIGVYCSIPTTKENGNG